MLRYERMALQFEPTTPISRQKKSPTIGTEKRFCSRSLKRFRQHEPSTSSRVVELASWLRDFQTRLARSRMHGLTLPPHTVTFQLSYLCAMNQFVNASRVSRTELSRVARNSEALTLFSENDALKCVRHARTRTLTRRIRETLRRVKKESARLRERFAR